MAYQRARSPEHKEERREAILAAARALAARARGARRLARGHRPPRRPRQVQRAALLRVARGHLPHAPAARVGGVERRGLGAARTPPASPPRSPPARSSATSWASRRPCSSATSPPRPSAPSARPRSSWSAPSPPRSPPPTASTTPTRSRSSPPPCCSPRPLYPLTNPAPHVVAIYAEAPGLLAAATSRARLRDLIATLIAGYLRTQRD